MNSYNKYHCFNCGEITGKNDYDYIGNTKVWICGENECHKELNYELECYENEVRQSAEEDDYNRYR